MKPPTIKLNKYYSLKYIQVPYDDRYYVVMRGNVECCKIKHTEREFLSYFIGGIYDRMDPLEIVDLAKRMKKFEGRVDRKNKYLDRK